MEETGAAEATLTKYQWFLRDLAAPLSNRPIKEISAAEILVLLQRIEKSGRNEAARKMRGALGRVFRQAVVTLRADTDPTTALKGALQALKVTGRAAILDEKKLANSSMTSKLMTFGRPLEQHCCS